MKNDHTIKTRAPLELWRAFQKVCRQDGDKPSEVIRKLIERYIKRRSK